MSLNAGTGRRKDEERTLLYPASGSGEPIPGYGNGRAPVPGTSDIESPRYDYRAVNCELYANTRQQPGQNIGKGKCTYDTV